MPIVESPVCNDRNSRSRTNLASDDGRLNVTISRDKGARQPLISPSRQAQGVSTTSAPGWSTCDPSSYTSLAREEGVQPFVALGKELRKFGHRVRVATHPTFKRFVGDHDLEFLASEGDPAGLMAFVVKNPGMIPGRQA